MPLTIKHAFVSAKADGTDATVVRPSNWNADHVVTSFDLGNETVETSPALPANGAALTINATDSEDDSISYGILLNLVKNPAATANYNAPLGVAVNVSTAGPADLSYTQLYGIQSAASHNGTGALRSLYAFEAGIQTGAGSGNTDGDGGPGDYNNNYGVFAYDAYFVLNGGTIASLWAFSVAAPNISAPASVITSYAFYAGDQTGATNPYYSWFDSRGVRRVKEDHTFDGVGQAIEALYNPQFTKYAPGAVNFERVVLGQWNGNTAEIGTQAGGTGVLRKLRLIGSSVEVPSVTTDALTVATLPAAPTMGQRAFVSDSNAVSIAAAFGTVVAGGGAQPAPVWYDGAAWRIG